MFWVEFSPWDSVLNDLFDRISDQVICWLSCHDRLRDIYDMARFEILLQSFSVPEDLIDRFVNTLQRILPEKKGQEKTIVKEILVGLFL